MNDDKKKKEINIIKQIAFNNGYKPEIIDKLIKHKNQQKNKTDDKDMINGYNKISYLGPISNKIMRILKKFKIKTTTKSINTLQETFYNNKDKINPMDKSGVYKIQCGGCKANYIGQTGRKLKTRLMEHKNKNKFSAVSQHLLHTGHTIKEENIKLIHNENKGKKLDLLEFLEIKRTQREPNSENLNDHENLGYTPLFDIFV